MPEYIPNKDLRGFEVGSDPSLTSEEKETTITVSNDQETVRIHSDIATHIKWVLSIPDSGIVRYRMVSKQVVGITADIPKGYIKLQGTNRQAQTNGAMVSYGEYNE